MDSTDNTGAVNDTEHSGSEPMEWYVVRIATGYEKQVICSLKEAVQLAGVAHKFGEILVPTEEVVEMRAGKKRKSQRKFFPGYVLLQMVMGDDTWHLVRHITKVLGFVGGTRDKPVPVSKKELEAILQRVEDGVGRPKHKVLFEVGEVLRVIDGPFADFSGVVEEVSYEKSRICVSVSIFGRATPVELEFGQVEKG